MYPASRPMWEAPQLELHDADSGVHWRAFILRGLFGDYDIHPQTMRPNPG